LERPLSSLEAYSTGTATIRAKDATTRANTVRVLRYCMGEPIVGRFSHDGPAA